MPLLHVRLSLFRLTFLKLFCNYQIVNDEQQKIFKLIQDSWFSGILGWIGGMTKLCLQLNSVKDGDIRKIARFRNFITVSLLSAVVAFWAFIGLDGFFTLPIKLLLTFLSGFAAIQILSTLGRLEKTIITKWIDKVCGFKEYKDDD